MTVLKTFVSLIIGIFFGFVISGAVYRFFDFDASLFIGICGAIFVFWKICPVPAKNWIKKWTE